MTKWVRNVIALPEGILPRLGTVLDVPSLVHINEAVFENEVEINEFVAKEQIVVFHRNEDLLGFAIFSRVIEDRPEFDVGMLVAPAHRRKGLGAAFLSHVVELARSAGGRPIMGCAVDNLGSRATIEKLGYWSQYRLLSLEF